MNELTFTDADGIDVFYRRWAVEAPRATVVIAHGASEHSGRYGRFASALNSAGFSAYALDHRGHGHTAASTGRGKLGPRAGEGVLDDMQLLIDIAVADAPDAPVVLFGHSMGSIFGQAFVERGETGLAAYVLSGCPGPLAEEMAGLVDGLRAAVDSGLGDEPIDMLGPFNEAFEPARTPYDWLSRDPVEVDAYVADPLCGDGMPLTQAYVAEMLAMALDGMAEGGIARTPQSLPVLLVTGEADPVSANGAQVRELESRLTAAGLSVTSHYYADARHEVLNETNRDEVTADIITWLSSLG